MPDPPGSMGSHGLPGVGTPPGAGGGAPTGSSRPGIPGAKTGLPDQNVLPSVRHTVAVASGKGGVGKSTVAVNLALGLSRLGYAVGLLDADIYGPSIPMMFGLRTEQLQMKDRRLIPPEKYGLRLMSLGFLVQDDSPLIWRGPMVHGVVSQFIKDVEWGELDFLVIDLPPGTGDAQLTLTQSLPLSGAVIVSTPQEIALLDARKGLKMFEKVQAPVLGFVENMSAFIAPDTGREYPIFSKGGVARAAAELGVDLLGEIPLDLAITPSGDAGEPIVHARPESDTARRFVEIARRVAAAVGVDAPSR
ncbi:MAG: Mrp/NBP35 family ATP-binding protein [Gemmatimonadota bacterium]